MQVKTLKGAFLTASRTIKKIFKEVIRKTKILNDEDGILYTDYSIFLIHLVKEFDKTFYKSFPDVAKQIFWKEGIKVNKKLIFHFTHIKNDEKKKLSILFVLKNGDIFQISPLSLMSFCEYTNLITEDKGINYFFPTIFLKRLSGSPTKNEVDTRAKLSLVAQINDLDTDEIDANELTFSPIQDFDTDWIGELSRALKAIDMRLERIEKELKKRNDKNA